MKKFLVYNIDDTTAALVTESESLEAALREYWDEYGSGEEEYSVHVVEITSGMGKKYRTYEEVIVKHEEIGIKPKKKA